MIYNLEEFSGKNVIFIGKNVEGNSFEAFIHEHANVASFKYIDSDDGPNYLKDLINTDVVNTIIVKSTECPGSMVPTHYTTTTKIFFECAKQLGAKTIGVTGTKGKSTTSTLVAYILTNAGYRIVLAGTDHSELLDSLKDATDQTIFVLELSSFQLADLEVSPDYAIITNLYRDHIDYHTTLENYWEAKRNIMRYMGNRNVLVFNPQSDMVLHWLAESDAQSAPIDPDEVVDMTKSQLIGDHNRLNFLLAKKLALTIGVDNYTISSSLATFKPIKHRLEKVRTVGGITYVDDAIATQPEATITGITTCLREIGPVGCVMLGGKDRDYDFTALVKLLSTLLIPKIVLFPDTGAKIKALFPSTYTPEIYEADDMESAVTWVSSHVPSGSVCLLSTASPSSSIWKDFEEKGDLFQKAVMTLSN